MSTAWRMSWSLADGWQCIPMTSSSPPMLGRVLRGLPLRERQPGEHGHELLRIVELVAPCHLLHAIAEVDGVHWL